MWQEKLTFCRICEPACSIVAALGDDGRVQSLRPNFDDPIGGRPCHKGLSFLSVHHDPDRLNWPRRRLNSRSEPRGKFVDMEWDDAIDEIATRIKSLIAKHGPNSVAFFTGNPFAFNSTAFMLAQSIEDALGTKMRFSVNTQDAVSRIAAAEAVFGTQGAQFVPDLETTQYLLCVGSNPQVSRWTMMATPNEPDLLKNIVKRGAKIVFVNPRVIESSTAQTGETLQIKPGSDVYFLAALIEAIHRLGRFDHDLLARRAIHVDGLIDFVSKYPAEAVADVTGISATAIRVVADEFSSAPSAVAYSATGLNQSGQGVLGAWLIDMLNLVTGNLGRPGGSLKPAGIAFDLPAIRGREVVHTSIGDFELSDPIGYTCLPSVVLPDLIEAGDIRALINLGGNPLLSIGGEARLRAAFEKLDLLVSLDIYPSATVEMSDFGLPGVDWLERPDFNYAGAFGMQTHPHLRYSDPVVSPTAGRRSDWWVLGRLAQALGIPAPLDDTPADKDGFSALEALFATQGLTIDMLRAAPGNAIRFTDVPPESLFDRCVKHPHGLIDCCPTEFGRTGLFQRCDEQFDERLSEPSGTMRLISRRTPHMHNGSLSNVETLRSGRQGLAPLLVCGTDAQRLGLADGDPVRVSTDSGEIETRAFIDDTLRPGVVAMSHGFGHRHAYGLSVAQRSPGANYNALPPTGLGTFEPLSNMSLLSGIKVHVERMSPTFEWLLL
jgi:anaerobic selenocysteine-containing dehydrogenase